MDRHTGLIRDHFVNTEADECVHKYFVPDMRNYVSMASLLVSFL
jgi:hypothetical protein